MASVYNGDAGGVVASILKTSQPVEQNGRCFRTTNVANDSAHVWSVVVAVLSRKIRLFGQTHPLQMRPRIIPTDTKNSFHLDAFTAICVIRGNFSQLQRQR
jgi:hypothetical protein